MASQEVCALIDAYVLRLMRESGPDYTAWNMEKIRQGAPSSWNYVDGCMMTALLSLYQITRDEEYFRFVDTFIGSFVGEDGTIRTFHEEKHTLDDINEGRVLFDLYEKTGREKYRLAAQRLKDALDRQPRTQEGSYWHKEIYPNQVWLDGIYMAQPFAALYQKVFGAGDYSDIVCQIETVRRHMRDDATGLYYHGYDASRKAFWCDSMTGLSRNFWLRAIGWFAVALADLLEILPAGDASGRLAVIFRDLMRDVLPFADPDSGLYWQVVNRGDAQGNYLESSGSSMLAYAMLKGARLGFLDSGFIAAGSKTFDGIVSRYLSFTDGTLNLGGICLVAGLGPENNRRRDGSLAYYLSEPVVQNDAKGVAPFLLCYTEIKRLQA